MPRVLTGSTRREVTRLSLSREAKRATCRGRQVAGGSAGAGVGEGVLTWHGPTARGGGQEVGETSAAPSEGPPSSGVGWVASLQSNRRAGGAAAPAQLA